MPRRVLVRSPTSAFNLLEVPTANEHDLQEVVKANPQLLPAQDLGLDGDLLVVGRETTLASGSIDLLCLSRTGELVLVEFKTGPQNPDFRHALAQVIDYGSDLWGLSVDALDKGVVQRFLSGPHVLEPFSQAHNLRSAVSLTDWQLTEAEFADLVARAAAVLQNGDFIYVIAAQRFTDTMTTSLRYLNATMRYGRFFLVEVVQLAGEELTAHAAQVVARPADHGGAAPATALAGISEEEFLAGLPDPEYRQAVADLFSGCATLGLVLVRTRKSATIRLKTVDLNEPLTLAWVFQEGAQWYGARHLTVGVDQQSLKARPSVTSEVTEFVSAIGLLPGAKRPPSQLDAYTFAPQDVPGAIQGIIAAFENLIERVQGNS
jgi:hypothetical protein